MVLNNKELSDIIYDILEENEDINYSLDDIEKVKNVYNTIKYDKVNVNKTKEELESLISMITTGVIMGEEEDIIVGEHLQSKGIFNFNVFLGDGQKEKVSEAIKAENISPDIFEGMQWMSNFDSGELKTEKGTVRIIYKVDTSRPESPIPLSLTITLTEKNGKKRDIYTWSNEEQRNFAKEYKEKRLLKEQDGIKPSNISWIRSADKEYQRLKDIEEKKFMSYKYTLQDTVRDVKGDKKLKEQVVLSNGQIRWVEVGTRKWTSAPKE